MTCFPLWWGLKTKVPKGPGKPPPDLMMEVGRYCPKPLANQVARRSRISSAVISLHCHVSTQMTRALKTFCLESQKQMFLLQLLIHDDVISPRYAVVLRKSADILFLPA